MRAQARAATGQVNLCPGSTILVGAAAAADAAAAVATATAADDFALTTTEEGRLRTPNSTRNTERCP